MGDVGDVEESGRWSMSSLIHTEHLIESVAMSESKKSMRCEGGKRIGLFRREVKREWYLSKRDEWRRQERR